MRPTLLQEKRIATLHKIKARKGGIAYAIELLTTHQGDADRTLRSLQAESARIDQEIGGLLPVTEAESQRQRSQPWWRYYGE